MRKRMVGIVQVVDLAVPSRVIDQIADGRSSRFTDVNEGHQGSILGLHVEMRGFSGREGE